jgi:hypothetical protein
VYFVHTVTRKLSVSLCVFVRRFKARDRCFEIVVDEAAFSAFS